MKNPFRILFMIFFASLCFSTALQAQNLLPGDEILLKLHDYHVATVVGKRGENYLVNLNSQTSRDQMVSAAQVIPLKKDWKVGDWILTDWTNERMFIRVQVVHIKQGRYLCVDWPQTSAKWRDYTTMVPLEYTWVLGNHYDSSRNYHKPDEAQISRDVVSTTTVETGNLSHSDDLSPLKINDPVEIEWRGTWYTGKLLEMKDGKYYVSYNGYTSTWNEWIGPERIKGVGATQSLRREGNSVESYPPPSQDSQGKVVWKIGDVAWNTFTNEGKYFRVKLLANDGFLWLCMDLKTQNVDWKDSNDFYVEKPEQTFYSGK